MKKLLLFLAIVALGCSKNDDESVQKYAGTWEGVFTGAVDNGAWEIEVSETGSAYGKAKSTPFSAEYLLVGSVTSQGDISLTNGLSATGATFSGKLNNNTASGTWINNKSTPPLTGDWQGTKK